MDAYLDAMRKGATFTGRSSRSEFWIFYGVYFGVYFVAVLLDSAFGMDWKGGGSLQSLVGIAHILPQVAVGVRRLHDTDRSGWWYLLAPSVIGLPVFIVFACLRGTAGPNRFGDAPLAVATPAPIAAPPAPVTAIAVGGPAAPMPPASSHVPTAHRDPIAEIERLGQLRSAGHLSQDEFDAMKTRILTQAHGA